MRMLQELPE
jgi:hypothetical protein